MAALTDVAGVDRLARDGAQNLLASLVSSTAGVVLVLVVTNAFPQATSGALFASTALFLLAAAICELGTDVGLARMVPRYRAQDRNDDIGIVLRVATAPVVLLSVLVAAALVLLAPVIADTVTDGTAGTDDLTAALRLLAIFLPFTTVYDTTLAATQALGSIRPTVLLERLGRCSGQVVAIVVVDLAGGGIVALAFAWVVPYVIALAIVVPWMGRLRRPSEGPEPLGPRADPDEVRREFWRFTAPRAVGQVLQVALQRVDIVLVSITLGVRDAAIYTVATRFLVFGQIGPFAVQQVLRPQLSDRLAHDDVDGARRLVRTATAWIVAIGWPVYLSFAVLAPIALDLFGEGYDEGATSVVILSCAMLLATAVGPADVVLLMAGRSGTSTLNGALALATDIVLVLVLTPRYGITGAAWAWAAALAVRNLLPVFQVRRWLGITTFGREAATVAVSVAVPILLVAPIVRWGLASDRPEAALLLVPALLAGGIALWRTKDRTGIASLVEVMRRRDVSIHDPEAPITTGR